MKGAQVEINEINKSRFTIIIRINASTHKSTQTE